MERNLNHHKLETNSIKYNVEYSSLYTKIDLIEFILNEFYKFSLISR